MLDFLLITENIWFSVAVFLVLSISLIEIIGMLTGLSLFGVIDDLFPLEADLDVGEVPLASPLGALSILGINRVPFSIWLLIFLASFGLSGLTLNLITLQIVSMTLPTPVTLGIAVICSFALTRVLSTLWAKLFPQSDSNAVSATSFEGLEGKITIGKAEQNSPAEAVVMDQHGQKHYLMVEPMDAGQTLIQGSKIILVSKQNNVWWAIPQSD